MAANTIDLAKLVHERIAPMIAAYGLDLPSFMIENISLPTDVEAALDKRTSTGIAGDLRKYTEFSAAEAMTTAARQPGGRRHGHRDRRRHGHGDGRAHGRAPAPGARHRPPIRQPPAPPATAAAAASPLARRRGRHGHRPLLPAPSSRAWPPDGTMTPDTHVWTPGGPAGRAAATWTDLADIFSAPRRRHPPNGLSGNHGCSPDLDQPARHAGENHSFPCPTCGSDLRFRPGRDSCAATIAATRRPIAERRGGIPELDLRAVEREQPGPLSEMEETRVVRCDSCGAEVEFDADLHATECPFCASPIVTDTGVHRLIKPQAQLPFLLDEEQARTAMNRWLGRLWFAPSNLQEYARKGRAA